MNTQELMTRSEVAEMTRLSTNTLAYLAHQGRGPAYALLGRRAFYRRSEVERWIEEQFEQNKFEGAAS